MKPYIRRATAADAGAASDLALRAKSHWDYPADWLRQWRAELTMSAEYLGMHTAYVAVDPAGTTVGVCVIDVRESVASIEHLWVAPECHKRGVGRALMAQALETAAHAGASTVEVLSDPFAEPFYVKLGARRIGQLPAPMPGAPERMLPLLNFVLFPGRSVAR
jgi:predicted N-acetyltransferase YhbS